MLKEDDPIERMMRTLAAALGRQFPNAEKPPTREELLEAAKVCGGAADMARELANRAERNEPA